MESPATWASTLRSMHLDGVTEIIPAASTVVVHCDPMASDHVGALLDTVTSGPAVVLDHEIVELDVVYDGPDLADVASMADITVAEAINLHESVTYRVGFCGFSPGFAYLTGLAEQLQLPRRTSPRTVVPAGSVAIAAGYTAVYPSASPGGWHLIGRTDAPVWDERRATPALLQPGALVRFREIRR
ncbi:MAG: 5-oxoprolinase subunit PxpB [Ilumatobacteraceae bacterium]